MELLTRKKIGALGRLLLPFSIRQDFGLKDGTYVGIYVDKNRNLVLKPLPEDQVCSFCNKPAKIEFKNRGICNGCIKKINNGEATDSCQK